MTHISSERAIQVWIVGGVFNFVLSYLLGRLLSAKRMRESMQGHHWLLTGIRCRSRRA